MAGQEKIVSDQILIGKKAFKEALNVQDSQLETFVKMGMPVLLVNGKWCGHMDNINDWFRAMTRVPKTVGSATDGDGE